MDIVHTQKLRHGFVSVTQKILDLFIGSQSYLRLTFRNCSHTIYHKTYFRNQRRLFPDNFSIIGIIDTNPGKFVHQILLSERNPDDRFQQKPDKSSILGHVFLLNLIHLVFDVFSQSLQHTGGLLLVLFSRIGIAFMDIRRGFFHLLIYPVQQGIRNFERSRFFQRRIHLRNIFQFLFQIFSTLLQIQKHGIQSTLIFIKLCPLQIRHIVFYLGAFFLKPTGILQSGLQTVFQFQFPVEFQIPLQIFSKEIPLLLQTFQSIYYFVFRFVFFHQTLQFFQFGHRRFIKQLIEQFLQLLLFGIKFQIG